MIDRLSRVTTSGRRIRELDGLRFIAIFTVIIQHVYEVVLPHYKPGHVPPEDYFAKLIHDWRIGVDLFFVISGFILAMPFAAHRLLGGKPVRLGAYYLRRITRLEPPYLLTLLLWYLVLVFYWHQSAREQLPHLLASAVYLHNIIYRGTNYMSTINSVAWSLEIEVQFYILAPLLAWVFLIRGRWLRRTVIVLGAMIIPQTFKLMTHPGTDLPVTVYGSLPMFLMGFLLADLFLTDWDQQPTSHAWGDLIALPGWLLLPFWFQILNFTVHGHRVIPTAGFCFVLLLLCWASFRSIWVKKFLASSFIMTVGGMCYTIYLLHFPMIRILGNYSPMPLIPGIAGIGVNTLIYLLLWGIPVMAASVVFFLIVEKPCMRKDWPQRLWARLLGKSLPDRTVSPVYPDQVEAFLDVPPAQTTPLSENQPLP